VRGGRGGGGGAAFQPNESADSPSVRGRSTIAKKNNNKKKKTQNLKTPNAPKKTFQTKRYDRNTNHNKQKEQITQHKKTNQKGVPILKHVKIRLARGGGRRAHPSHPHGGAGAGRKHNWQGSIGVDVKACGGD